MSLTVYLVRHGNTFNTGDKVVMVGCNNDLPLTDEGERQAIKVGEYLKRRKIDLFAAMSGPLKRHTRTAALICETLNISGTAQVDARLNEFDYGLWTGLTSEEIEKKWPSEWSAWNERGEWPAGIGFKPERDTALAEIEMLMKFLAGAVPENNAVLIVSSGGRMRSFLTLVQTQSRWQSKNGKYGKVGTGRICTLKYEESMWQIEEWNTSP